MHLSNGTCARAAVPSGASTGKTSVLLYTINFDSESTYAFLLILMLIFFFIIFVLQISCTWII